MKCPGRLDGGRVNPTRLAADMNRSESMMGMPRQRSRTSSDILFLKHDSSIFRQSSNQPYMYFLMMEQVMLCAVWPTGTVLALP